MTQVSNVHGYDHSCCEHLLIFFKFPTFNLPSYFGRIYPYAYSYGTQFPSTSLASSSEDSSKISPVDQMVPLGPLDLLSMMQKPGDARVHLHHFSSACEWPLFVVVSSCGLALSQRMRTCQTVPVMTSEALQFLPVFQDVPN